MIRIICFGKIKEEYLKKGIDDYINRIKKYHKLQIIELKDNDDISLEEKEVIKYFDSKNLNVILAIEGKKFSSLNLAEFIDKSFINYNNITFFIGGSNGFTDFVKSKADLLLSFGDITMPHGLFRLVLTEQIYRAFKINNHEKYHK